MDKGLLFFIIVFVALIGAGVYMGNADQITPTIAQAQAEMSIGVAPVQVLEKGASWLLKLFGGALFTGIVAASFTELRKVYKLWKRNWTMRRWQSGPNAQWQQSAPRTPSLTRADLFTMLLAGKVPENNRINPRVSPNRVSDDDEAIDLEF